MRAVVVNLNLDPAAQAGCRAIAVALGGAHITAFADEMATGLALGANLAVLGPQGVPFSNYPPGFLPWLAGWLQRRDGPLLAICGGMQAAALAWGGALQTVDGRPQVAAASYAGCARIDGPVGVEVEWARVPGWLAPALRRASPLAPCLGRHSEQIARLPGRLQAIASTPATPVQAWTHPERRWLGCQFHPEHGDGAAGKAGAAWIAAFLAAAR